jgi:hypothetical protein
MPRNLRDCGAHSGLDRGEHRGTTRKLGSDRGVDGALLVPREVALSTAQAADAAAKGSADAGDIWHLTH